MVADHKPERRPVPDRRLVSLRNERQSLIRARPHRTTHSESDPTGVRPLKDVSRLASICLFAFAFAFAMVACSGDPAPETPTQASPTATRGEATPTVIATSTPTAAVATATPSPTSAPARSATATAEPTPIASGAATSPSAPDGLVRGGVVRFAVPELPPHLDVHQTQSPALLTWGPAPRLQPTLQIYHRSRGAFAEHHRRVRPVRFVAPTGPGQPRSEAASKHSLACS